MQDGFEWLKECKDVFCLSFSENSSGSSETRAEATHNVLGELSEKRLLLIGHDIAWLFIVRY